MIMVPHERVRQIFDTYRSDPESVYQTWFINGPERLKAFRAIRCGVAQVVDDIKTGAFPNDFRSSSLEAVLNSITEQKQVFEGAAHAFYWKPKLRIPDIYENETNKLAFGQFLEGCLTATKEEHVLREIHRLDARNIKGLGPAVANILYFLHPTLLPPSNTAMVRGFNLLFNRKQKLGSWESYLEMRNVLLQLNEQFRSIFSKDLGAVSGLLFEIGTGKIVIEQNANFVAEAEQQKAIALQKKRRQQVEDERHESQAHTEIQYLLTQVGKALGYEVLVAANDRGKDYGGDRFSFHCLCELPRLGVPAEVAATIDLIDVLWFEKGSNRIVCAFEVEKSTSIYSGILRLADLAIALPGHETLVCLVAPDEREREVLAQLQRPSLVAVQQSSVAYLLFSDLRQHGEAIGRFGADWRVLEKLVRRVTRSAPVQ